MRMTDIVLPHRLLMNRSLRKASDDLREHIEKYQVRVDQEVENCKKEIEERKEKKRADLEAFKTDLEQELSKDNVFFEKVMQDVLDYVEPYFQEKCLSSMLMIKNTENNVYKEESRFYSEQMSLIGKEIDLLEARKAILAGKEKIDDVFGLLSLSAIDLNFTADDTAQVAVEKITEELRSCGDSEWQKRAALGKLRSLLQERVEYQAKIQYIDWVIDQKKLVSGQLKARKKEAKEKVKGCNKEISDLIENLDFIRSILYVKAKTVRDNWEIPIKELSEQIRKLNEGNELVEYRRIRKRLSELYRNEEFEKKQKNYEQVKEKVETEKTKKEMEYADKVSADAEQYKKIKNKFDQAAVAVERCKKADNRLFIARIFSESSEVKRAREKLKVARHELDVADRDKAATEKRKLAEISMIESQLRGLKPSQYVPTEEERKEISQLMARKNELKTCVDFAAAERQLLYYSQERKRWFERKDMMFQICKRNHIYLLPENRRGKNGH